MKKRTLPLLSIGLLIFAVGTAHAVTTTQTLGSKQFNDGDTPTTGAFLVAHAGGTAPFDGVFSGSDGAGPNFSASWTFSYGALSNVISATFDLGIYDHESAATGSQVASFTLNGNDLTSLLDTAFEASPGASREVKDYTLTLPSSVFSALETGTATFLLNLQGPGLGILGETQFNGAALDFSTITITTQAIPPPPTVPEPAAGFLVLVGISTFVAAGARGRRRAFFQHS